MINISCPLGPQQQTHHSSMWWPVGQTHRWTPADPALHTIQAMPITLHSTAISVVLGTIPHLKQSKITCYRKLLKLLHKLQMCKMWTIIIKNCDIIIYNKKMMNG